MSQSTPVRSRQSFRHEAFLYRDASDFLATLVPFVDEGLAGGEPVMAGLVGEHADWLRDGLGDRAAQVTFVDLGVLGRNPARLVSVCEQFLASHQAAGTPTRGIGESIWPGRRDEEVAECQLNEALLSVAVHPETPFWLICPYQVRDLGASVIAEAQHSHPALLDDGSYRGSTTYAGRAHVDALFCAELPPLPGRPLRRTYTSRDAAAVFALVLHEAYAADLWSDKALDLALAARQLATDSLQRGADKGVIKMWHRPDALICELSDSTAIDDVLAGRRVAPERNSAGLWAANRACDLVQLRSTASGSTVRLYSWK